MLSPLNLISLVFHNKLLPSILFCLTTFIGITGLFSQSAYKYQLNTLISFENDHDVRAVLNELIDDAISGTYDPKYFGYPPALSAEEFQNSIPEELKDLVPLSPENKQLDRFLLPKFDRFHQHPNMANILFTTRWNKVKAERQLVVLKVYNHYGDGVIRDFEFLAPDGEEVKIIGDFYGCSLRFLLLGENYTAGCKQGNIITRSNVPPPPPPPLSLPQSSAKKYYTTKAYVESRTALANLYDYPNLEELEINCSYCLDFPIDIGYFKRLKKFSISGSRIYYPPTDYSDLDSLEELIYYNNSSPYTPSLRGFEALKYLKLFPTKWTDGFPAFVQNIETLERLEVIGLRTRSFPSMENLRIKNLDKLTLRWSDIPPLEAFPGLKELEIISPERWGDYNYSYKDIPTTLSKVHIVTKLDSLPEIIYQIPNLNELSLSYQKKMPKNLERLQVNHLEIGGNMQRDTFPFFINKMPNLTSLHVKGVNRDLFSNNSEHGFPQIEEITFGNGAFPSLNVFPNLKKLTLRHWLLKWQPKLIDSSFPVSLSEIVIATEVKELPEWFIKLNNITTITLDAKTYFPIGLADMNISELRINSVWRDKIPENIMTKLEAKRNLKISFFN